MLAALLVAVGAYAQDASDSMYVSVEELPDGGYFLPAPPTLTDTDFADDMVQWQWGKAQRGTERGPQASRESLWLPEVMRMVMGEALGIDSIADETMPALSRLLVKCYNTGDKSTARAKDLYMRTRPFVQMGDPLWAQYDTDFLRTNGSYPSGHTAFGWATALAFAEMWPVLQDTILRRGFQFGENRIITGAHYQSDVNAGYLCGAAAIARVHACPDFEADLLAARAEYAALKGIPVPSSFAIGEDGLPHGERILNLPVDTASYRYPAELIRYWQARTLRDTERGEEAIAHVDNTEDGLMAQFGAVAGITITREATPAMAELICTVRTQAKAAAKALKDTNFRKRPYVQLGEATPVPWKEEEERTESSFASGHANLGWAEALALAEVMHERQDDILRFGYDYGYSRLIVGYHWATDIEAARLLACTVIARLHADADFRTLLAQARAEYETATGIREAAVAPMPSSSRAYTLGGLPATATTQGIVIEAGRKTVRHMK